MLPLLLTIAAFPVQNPPIIYIPGARLKMTLPEYLTPILRSEAEVQSDLERYGTLLRSRWSVENRFGLFQVSHWRYPGDSAPKMTSRQIAEELFEISRDLAEQLDKSGSDRTFMLKHEKKFMNRKVTETKVGKYTAYLDSHEDSMTKSRRRYLAWGDQKEQWQVELVGRGDVPSIDSLLELILQKVSVGPIADGEAKGATLVLQRVPTLEATISAPGVFDVMARPGATTSRPGGKGLSATMSLRDDYVVHIAQDKYTDDKVSDTFRQANRLLQAMDMPGYEVKSSKIIALSIGDLKGHALRMEYVENETPMYGISACFARLGYDLVVHINIAKALGGKEKADAILATLRPRP